MILAVLNNSLYLINQLLLIQNLTFKIYHHHSLISFSNAHSIRFLYKISVDAA